MDTRYQDSRRHVEEVFLRASPIEGESEVDISPSGNFRLEISEYSTGPNTWTYSRGIVTRVSDGRVIADVKRNLGHFWFCWVAHPNGKEYLLCGEDYQGYCVVNLTDETYHVYFPEEGHGGSGFCWTKVYPSPDGLVIAVDGCFWACPYDLVLYDFRTPDELPYRELGRTECLMESEGWVDNATFALTKELEFRASDGEPYESLSDSEQSALDEDPSLVAFRGERLLVARPSFPAAT